MLLHLDLTVKHWLLIQNWFRKIHALFLRDFWYIRSTGFSWWNEHVENYSRCCDKCSKIFAHILIFQNCSVERIWKEEDLHSLSCHSRKRSSQKILNIPKIWMLQILSSTGKEGSHWLKERARKKPWTISRNLGKEGIWGRLRGREGDGGPEGSLGNRSRAGKNRLGN